MVFTVRPVAPWGSEQEAVQQVRDFPTPILWACALEEKSKLSPWMEETPVGQGVGLGRSRDMPLSEATLDGTSVPPGIPAKPGAVVIGLQR